MTGQTQLDPGTQRSNRKVAILCLAFTAGMIGMAYAAVPLYAMFCQVTGYGGTAQRVEQYFDRGIERPVTVRFDANTAGVPWRFEPGQRSITLKMGETVQVAYEAVNLSDTPVAGRATFNVTPEQAGAYFNKVECFCFTDTTLKPGEKLDMPVVFFVDPAIDDVAELKDLKTITLSYTFFPLEGPKPVAATAPADGEPKTTTDGNLGG